MNLCICFRGELLRTAISCGGVSRSKVLECDYSEENMNRQNDIMKSIINHVIIPYRNKGYNIFISGCVYKCPQYNEKLEEFFPNNTIKQIEPGTKGQVQMFKESIVSAYEQHPNCDEYISLRPDYIMLKDIIIKDMKGEKDYVGVGWSNMGSPFPDCDVFYRISNNFISTFISILWKRGHGDSHYVPGAIRKRKVTFYPIWGETYRGGATGISYNTYLNDFQKHKNRPFVNYMRDDALHPRNTHLKPGRASVSENTDLK